MNRQPAILILAAGASRRMRGEDKLLREIDGTPLLLRAARAAAAVSDDVLITLPASDRARRAWLGDSPATLVDVVDIAMSASIRAGVARCDADAVLIHLADMPEIDADALRSLTDAWTTCDTPILRATTEDGRPGQPVIFARSLFPALMQLEGDTGARNVIDAHPATSVALPGEAATVDLDTPEAWTAWLNNRTRGSAAGRT
ncbi:MAG: nucleotidyltransferase family protein [Pseudomonadota bacterium]